MAAELSASTATVTGASTASVLAGAAVGVPVGRWLDRHGGRALMTGGSALATVLVLAWSQVRTVPQLYLVLTGVGLASGAVLYEAAFAVVVSWSDPHRRADALLVVTVVAGFASTVFLPLTAVLVERAGWRSALVVLGLLYGALAVPLHGLVLRRAPRAVGAPHAADAGRRDAVRAALRDPGFWLLTVAFVANAAATGAMAVHLVGFLVDAGHSATFAATVAGLLGVLSVAGRLLLAAARRRVPLALVVAAVFGLQAVAAAALPWLAGARLGAVAGVVAFGLGFGASSLAKPALLADRYGTTAYGTISGALSTPVIVSRATAPLGAAVLLTATGSYRPVLVAVGVACLVAALGLARSVRPG